MDNAPEKPHRPPSTDTRAEPKPGISDSNHPPDAEPDTSQHSPFPQSPSLVDRIQSSASGLLRDAVSGRSGGRDDASATLARSLAEKGGESAGAATGGGSSFSQQVISGSSVNTSYGGTTTSGSGGLGDTFRSTGAGQLAGAAGTSAEADLESFTRGPAGEEVLGNGIQSKWKGKDRAGVEENGDPHGQNVHTRLIHDTPSPSRPFEDTWTSRITSSSGNNNNSAQQPAPDGHAVSSLLSDPSFQPLSHPTDALDDLDADQDTQPNPFIPPPPPPQTTSTQSPTTLDTTTPTQVPRISLVPGLDTTSTSTTSATTAEPNLDTLLSTLSDVLSLQPADAEANQPWLSLDALYHDAVYGNYIEPYVRSAAEEVRAYDEEQAAKKGDGEGNEGGEGRLEALRQGKAVRRLQMVLGHLRTEMADAQGGEGVR